MQLMTILYPAYDYLMSSLCPTHVQLMSESGHQLDIGFTFSLGLQSGSKFQFSMFNFFLV